MSRVRVAYMVTNERGEREEIEFTLENELPPAQGGSLPASSESDWSAE